MNLLGKILSAVVGDSVEEDVANQVIDRQWPAIEKTLREQFSDDQIDVALKAGRVACERLIEHAM